MDFGKIGAYLQLGLMKIQGKEAVCHNVGERCKKTQIKTMDILEAKVGFLSQHISSSYEKKYQDKTLIFTEQKDRQLTIKEAAQLIWHSFRFSNGNAALQFTILYLINRSLSTQNISLKNIEESLKKLLNVGKTHTTTTVREWENPDGWRPPHPKVCRTVTTIEHGTDITLSQHKSHGIITSEMIEDGVEVIKMLLTGKGGLTSKDTDRDGFTSYISRKKEYEYVGKNIEAILEMDFGYLLKKETNYSLKGNPEVFIGRPNRKHEHDGDNTLKDRFFSYFVWYIVRKNITGNDFFDMYFEQLHNFFPNWFSGLPTDLELDEENTRQRKEKEWHSKKRPFRKGTDKYYLQITKEDVLLLIAQYNATHPDTQVDVSELGLNPNPQYFR